MKCQLLVYVVFVVASYETGLTEDLIYGYECQQSRCIKTELSEKNFGTAISLPVCRLLCGDTLGTLWPKPTGVIRSDPLLLHIDSAAIEFHFPSSGKRQTQIWNANKERFNDLLSSKITNINVLKTGGHSLQIVLSLTNGSLILTDDEVPRLSLDTDESYKLLISTNQNGDKIVTAEIVARTFFGARHGLETLSQLIVYDDIRHELQVLAKVEIEDGPVYKWRGLLLDTSRNFYSVKAIKRTLDAMAMVKLNTFHWHITDSQSFPLELKSQPELYKLGAYSQRKIYRQEEIAEIVEYGRVRGIRVMPEFDAPAHVGEGWQHKDMTACFNAQPWRKYCGEPPCGQLDPTVDDLYPVLEDIYREIFDLFDPDVFHMGGDEVSVNCWNSSDRIKTWMKVNQSWNLEEADFMRLWGYFQTKALERIDRVSKSKNPIPITLWTSDLTKAPYIDEYLNKDRYIIQIWTRGYDMKIQDILKRGYHVIISNSDALYFDCGGPGVFTDGNNWCSPYIGWQKVYNNNLKSIAGDYEALVLGAEAAIWSEQIDEFTLEYRLWPRASALAERLWTDPNTGWRQAEARLLFHREQLVDYGLGAEAMQPEWCLQNENECPVDAYKTQF